MRDDFFTKEKCDRCGSSLAYGRTMSMFNTDCICMKCKDAETRHPRYREAAEAEMAEVKKGNRWFGGIGYK